MKQVTFRANLSDFAWRGTKMKENRPPSAVFSSPRQGGIRAREGPIVAFMGGFFVRRGGWCVGSGWVIRVVVSTVRAYREGIFLMLADRNDRPQSRMLPGVENCKFQKMYPSDPLNPYNPCLIFCGCS